MKFFGGRFAYLWCRLKYFVILVLVFVQFQYRGDVATPDCFDDELEQ